MATPKKPPPSREQLIALAAKIKDAPGVNNQAQMDLWLSIGKADGWAAMSPSEKESYRARHSQLA